MTGSLGLTLSAKTKPLATTPDTSASETLSLDECVARARANNHKRKISRFEIDMAQALHRQALSGYWPQIDFEAGVQRSDQAVNFLLPTQSLSVPAANISIPPTTALVTIPANAFGPGFPPANVQLPVASGAGTITTSPQTLAVPAQSLKVLDRDLASGNLKATYLLFDGGLRKGLREQSVANIEAMTAEAHRTDLEVEDSVLRMYWGAVLAHQLANLGNDVLARMQITLRLTETYVNEATGKVNRTNYLFNKVIVESIRSALAELEKNETLARAALANDMGLAWNASVRPADVTLPEPPVAGALDQLVGETYQFNPDWQKLEAGIRAADAALDTVRSDNYPKLAITGSLRRFWNGSYNGGLATSQNLTGWTIGAGMQVPIFNGLLTHNKTLEALARVRKLKETQLLLKDGLGLQVKSLLTETESARKIMSATHSALESADENRELTMQAYENDMMEPEKVVQAQLIAALIHAQYLKSRYDALSVSSQLSALVGREVASHVGSTPPAPTGSNQPLAQ